MQFKKLLKCSIFAAAAAICAAATTVSVQAADGSFLDSGISNVTIDTNKQELKATATGGELLAGIGKVNTKKGTITVSAWDSYTGTNAHTIDLSKLNNTKDNYIVLASNSKADVSVIKIPAADKAISAKFDPSTSKISVGTGQNAAAAKSAAKEITNDAFEYRTAYGNWKNLQATSAQVDLTLYQHEGATLYVRAKGTTGATATSLSNQSDEKLTYGEQPVKVYIGDSLPSKEAKVAIPADPKGPSVSVNYTTDTIILPKNTEYRLVTESGIKEKDGKPAENLTKEYYSASFMFYEFNETSNKDGVLEVRTAAKPGKKAASKWTRIAIKMEEGFATNLLQPGNTLDTKPTSGESKEYGGKGVALATLKESLDGSSVLEIEYVKSKKKDALKIQNNGSLTYEVSTMAEKDATEPIDAKIQKLAPGKTILVTGAPDESSVFIRTAGNQKAKQWVGRFEKLGIMDYPKTYTP